MRQVIPDEAPANARAVAEQAVLALNSSMMTLYEHSLNKFKQNMREKAPIILALFTGQGGQMILYRPGHDPEIAPPVPIVYQILLPPLAPFRSNDWPWKTILARAPVRHVSKMSRDGQRRPA